MAVKAKYPTMEAYLRPLVNPEKRKMVGRVEEVKLLLAALNRPIISNAMLLGPAGSGKTTLVYGASEMDPAPNRHYYEVRLPLMSAGTGNTDGSVQMAARMTKLVDEIIQYQHETGQELILFMDEIHQIVKISPAAMEAIKPVLANSGAWHIKIIGATTYEEYNEYIRPNEALTERFVRISLPELTFDETVEALKGELATYLPGEYADERLMRKIVTVTNQALPAESQPRKSLKVLDAMIGWHKTFRSKLDMSLLAKMMSASVGVDINYQVDAAGTEKAMNKRVFDQTLATRAVADRLFISVAGLNDKTRPRGSFLFTGPTGVGKQIVDSVRVPVYDPRGFNYWKRNGDLKVGDFVFSRDGHPEKIIGVYPHKHKQVYRVKFTDGRYLDVGAEHLWQYKSRYGNGAKKWKVTDTVSLMHKVMDHPYFNKGRNVADIKFVIPMNQPVQWPEMNLDTDPYLVGAFIGNGCLTERALKFSSDDKETVNELCNILNSSKVYRNPSSYSWTFSLPEDKMVGSRKYYQTEDVIPDGLIGKYSYEKFIPEEYQQGSIEQRWSLIQGLFDTDGSISNDDRRRVNYSTTSLKLAKDIQHVLYSLGVSSQIRNNKAHGEAAVHDEYHLHVQCDAKNKPKFFRLSRKKKIAEGAIELDKHKKRVKKFDQVLGIRSIEKLDKKEDATCIMVDDPEHLYQAGDFIVTHNTELAKTMANLLFGSDNRMIRFDMSEYAKPDSVDSLRKRLTEEVWEHPSAVILLDEIEKAAPACTKLMLQVLDDARMTDEHGREVSFKDAYIIFTTNAGAETFSDLQAMYQKHTQDIPDAQIQQEQRKMLKSYMPLIQRALRAKGSQFPPELLGRFDSIVPFSGIAVSTRYKICNVQLNKLKETVLQEHGVHLHIDASVNDYIVREHLGANNAESGGGREVKRRIDTDVTSRVAEVLVNYPQLKDLRVTIVGHMSWNDKNDNEGTAEVAVGKWDGVDREWKPRNEAETA